jgi:predicted nucleotidyltransferase
MEDFVACVRDRRARDLLARAISGRGAFRRFKDTLFEFPELREQWFGFHEARMLRRAVGFLVDEGLVSQDDADRFLAELDDPLVGAGPGADPHDVAETVAQDLRDLFGDRLVEVVLYGSQARGDAHRDSGIDLAVVLDRVESPWDELRQMDAVLWRHTLASGMTVSATPIGRAAWAEATRPLVRTAKAEGERLA